MKEKKFESLLYIGIILMITCGIITLFNFTSDVTLYLGEINYLYVTLVLIAGIASILTYILKNK